MIRNVLAVLALAALACRVSGPGNDPTPLAGSPTLAPEESQALPTKAILFVAVGNWNCRDAPGGNVVAYASVGQEVEVLAEEGGWVEVSLSGKKCWLRKEALRE